MPDDLKALNFTRGQILGALEALHCGIGPFMGGPYPDEAPLLIKLCQDWLTLGGQPTRPSSTLTALAGEKWQTMERLINAADKFKSRATQAMTYAGEENVWDALEAAIVEAKACWQPLPAPPAKEE